MFLQVVSAPSVLLRVCYWQICDLRALSLVISVLTFFSDN